MSIPALIRLEQQGGAIAVTDEAGDCSWQELFAGALAVARYCEEAGLASGDHLALWPNNSRGYFQCLLGCVLAGVWVTPLNRHLTADEIAYIVQDSGSKLLLGLGEPPELQLPLPWQPVPTAAASLPETNELPGLLQALLPGVPGGALMYTSGTTGRPKGVKRSAAPSVGETLASWCLLGAAIGLDGEGCHLVTGPLYHAAPGLYALYDLLNGSRVVLMPRWDAEACLALIEKYQVTHTHLVPTLFVRLLRQRQHLSRDYRLDSLQLVLHGAAPVSPAVKQSMIDWWGPVLVEYWGASESGIITRVDSDQWLQRPGTVGQPLPQYQLSVRDEEFRQLPEGEVGELYARREGVRRPFEYYHDPEKTAASYHDDWFTLGDLGWLDGEGYAYIADRRSNLIISGGVNIYPAEVEGVLLAHPEVADAVVVGKEDPEWGKRVHAVVQPCDTTADPGQLEARLQTYLEARLARFKLPRSWEFTARLPRYESGKLYKSRL